MPNNTYQQDESKTPSPQVKITKVETRMEELIGLSEEIKKATPSQLANSIELKQPSITDSQPSTETLANMEAASVASIEADFHYMTIENPIPVPNSKPFNLALEKKREQTSANEVDIYRTPKQKQVFFKSVRGISAVLEATSALIFRFISSSDCVPRVTLYYDSKGICGSASEAWENFVPYAKDNLKASDLEIKFLGKDVIQKREKIVGLLNQLTKEHLNTNEIKSTDSISTTAWKWGAWTVSYLKNAVSYEANSESVRPIVLNAITRINEPAFKDKTLLLDLQLNLQKRITHIISKLIPSYKEGSDKAKNYQEEINLINLINKEVSELILLNENQVKIHINELVEFERIIHKSEKAIKAAQKKSGQSIKDLQSLNTKKDNDTITCTVFENLSPEHQKKLNVKRESLTLTKEDVLRINTIKGQGRGTSGRKASRCNDFNANNFSKKGEHVDFEKLDHDFTYIFTKPSEDILKNITENIKDTITSRAPVEGVTFIDSIKNITESPVTVHGKTYYDPAAETTITQERVEFANKALSLNNTFSKAFNNNAYKAEDAKIFRQLATHPIYIFYKFVTYAKIAICDESTLRAMVELNMNNTDLMPKSDLIIREEYIKYKSKCFQNFTWTLLATPQFYEFLNESGEYAFTIIEEEIKEEKDKMQRRIAKGRKGFEVYDEMLNTEKFRQHYDVFLKLAKLSEAERNHEIHTLRELLGGDLEKFMRLYKLPEENRLKEIQKLKEAALEKKENTKATSPSALRKSR